MPCVPKPGDFVIYGKCGNCLGQVTKVEYHQRVSIQDKNSRSGAVFSLDNMKYVIPYRLMPTTFVKTFLPGNGFFPRYLEPSEINDILDHVATIIQQHMKRKLYSPNGGCMFIRLKRKWDSYL
jgi:hypothetical protein